MTSNDASLGLWWHYVITSLVDIFMYFFRVIYQDNGSWKHKKNQDFGFPAKG